MIEPLHQELSLSRQFELLGVSRSWYYYKPSEPVERDDRVMLMHEVKKEYLLHPFYGFRRINEALNRKGIAVMEKRIRTLMKEMGLQAIYPKPKLSSPNMEHKKYPYLLRGMEILHVNQAWATDITYIKLNGDFVYLVAIIDLHSRKVLSWRISNTLDAEFCIEALREALSIYGDPEIFNTDQGCQFTSCDFISVLEEQQIKISMDGKGRALDNVYIERLWRSLKYENIFLNEYKNLKELKGGVSSYFEFYNSERYHQSLTYRTPDEVYFAGICPQEPVQMEAA